MASDDPITLDDAIARYVGSVKKKDNQLLVQQELFRLAQWFGPSRSLADLKPYEVEEYGERLDTGTRAQGEDRVKALRGFFSYAKKNGLTDHKLALQLRIRKSRSRARQSEAQRQEAVQLTAEGFKGLQTELSKLKGERRPIAAEISRAAADKDVRENAPLEAAREQLGYVESRIRDIEATMKAAVVIDSSGVPSQSVKVGATVAVKDAVSGRETTYTVVSAAEANPLQGKISNVSPVGKALMNRRAGDEVEVVSPRGVMRYVIVKVGR